MTARRLITQNIRKRHCTVDRIYNLSAKQYKIILLTLYIV